MAKAEAVRVIPPRTPKGRDSVHRFVYLDLNHTGNQEDYHYVDLPRLMSAVNRRLYQQGRVYHVANATIHDSQGNCEVRFCTAPNTWPVRAAWNAMFQAWKRQRAQLLAMTGGTPRKTGDWSDFKVYLNKDHVSDADWPSPVDSEQDAVQFGEWNYATLTSTVNGTEHTDVCVGLMGSHALGSNVASTSTHDGTYSGYASALSALKQLWTQPQNAESPTHADTLSDSFIIGMSLDAMGADANLDDMLDEVEDENNKPPYGNVFAGEGAFAPDPWVVREAHLSSSNLPMQTVGGFPVPCGLLCIETKSGGDNTIGVLLELVPGDYKGLAAEPMWD